MFVCVCIGLNVYLTTSSKGHFSWPWRQELKDDKNKHLWHEYKGSWSMRQLYSSALIPIRLWKKIPGLFTTLPNFN